MSTTASPCRGAPVSLLLPALQRAPGYLSQALSLQHSAWPSAACLWQPHLAPTAQTPASAVMTPQCQQWVVIRGRGHGLAEGSPVARPGPCYCWPAPTPKDTTVILKIPKYPTVSIPRGRVMQNASEEVSISKCTTYLFYRTPGWLSR